MKSKYDQETWDKTKALYESGESVKAIEKRTGINRGSVSRKASKEGWEKDKLQPLVEQSIQAEIQKDKLDATQRNVVEELVEEKVRNTRLIHQLTKLNLKDVSEKLQVGLDTISDNKLAQEAIDKASITLGVNQRFSNNYVNIDAQSSTNEIRIVRDADN